METLPDVQSDILRQVWGLHSYDENHLDPAELSSKISFNVEWLLRTLAAGDTAEPPAGLGDALALADEIGRTRAIQGVAVDALSARGARPSASSRNGSSPGRPTSRPQSCSAPSEGSER